MRDIKFRAWNGSQMDSVTWMQEESGVMCYAAMNSDYWDDGLHSRPDIILMQYTGLKDKNEVEIYEGDIVKVPYYGSHSNSKVVVVSIDDCECSPFNSFNHREDGYAESEDSEVIGNIHENPELLEKRK